MRDTMEYFYIIRHKSSGRKYAGSKYSKYADPSMFMTEDGYTTSSRIINEIISNEGLEAFIVEELRMFPDGGAFQYETEYLISNNCAESKEWFNCTNNHFAFSPEERKKFNLEFYGNENPFITEKYKNKAKETNIKRYGAEYAASSPIIRERVRKTRQSEEGKKRTKEGREKSKKTNMELYGVEYSTQRPEVQEKTKNSNLEKYGTENVMHNEEIKQRHLESIHEAFSGESLQRILSNMKATNIERYGVENAASSPIIKERIKQKKTEKYGENYGMLEAEKRISTMKERYGVENISMLPEIKQKKLENAIAKYGDHPARVLCICPYCSKESKMNYFGKHAKECFPKYSDEWIKPSTPEEWKVYFKEK